MAVTDKDMFRVLKEIAKNTADLNRAIAKLSIPQGGGGGGSVTRSMAGVESRLDTISALLTTIDADTSQMQTDLTAVNTNTDGIEALLTTIDTSLDAIESDEEANRVSLNEIESVLEQEILTELESIDANWNLLSVNQLNLAAILTAVLNNATSGNQTTIIGHVDGIEGKIDTVNTNLGDIKTDLDDVKADIQDLIPAETYASDLALSSGVLTATDVVASGDVVELTSINIVTDDETARIITFDVVDTAGADPVLGTFSVISTASPYDWETVAAELSELMGTTYDDAHEIRVTIPAITADKSITVTIGFKVLRRNAT